MKKLILIKNFTKADIGNNPNFLLSPNRKKRSDLLKSEEEKIRFLSAEKITATVLSTFFSFNNPEIYGDAGQKPIIKNHNEISFSRSYNKNILALAVENTGAIGIDCENIKKADKNIIKYFFTETEKEYLKKSNDKDFAFTLIWTRKESYIKCNGEGLKYGFNLLDTTPDLPIRNGQKLFDENAMVDGYYINSYRIEDTVISVCSEVNDSFPLFIQKG